MIRAASEVAFLTGFPIGLVAPASPWQMWFAPLELMQLNLLVQPYFPVGANKKVQVQEPGIVRYSRRSSLVR